MSGSRRSAYNEAVSRASSEERDEESVRIEELRALIRFGLGYDLDAPTFLALAEIQGKLRAKQSKLALNQDGGRLSPEQYLTKLHAALEQFERQAIALLGRRQYEAVFGDGGATEKIVDEETFLGHQSSH